MTIPLSCDCGRKLNLKDELAGKKIKCPACKEVLLVPKPVKAAATRPVAVSKPKPAARPKPAPPDADEDDAPYTVTLDAEPIPDESEEPAPKPRKKKKKKPKSEGGMFAMERNFLNGGVVGGLLLMLVAVVWFVGGLAVGYIFFYPPILFVLGLIGFCKGLMGTSDN